MTFWSGERLVIELPHLIRPFEADQINCAKYTLHVGPEIYVTPNYDVANPSERPKRKLGDGEAFTIPTGQFAFILTEEIIKVPNSTVAFISIKTRVKYKGLVNVSGFHVDPGWNGRLLFSVYNAGPTTIHLQRGDQLFLIWYADLDRESRHPYVKPGSLGHMSIDGSLITDIHGEIHSLNSLTKKMNDQERSLDEKIRNQDARLNEKIQQIAIQQAWTKATLISFVTLVATVALALLREDIAQTLATLR